MRLNSYIGGTVTYPADNIKSSAGVATKVRTGGDGAMGHDWSGNVGLDEHPVRQGRVSGLVLLRGQGVQDGSINSQGTHRRSSGIDGGWRGSRVNASSGVGIPIALCGDASKERTARSIIGVAVSARRTIASSGLRRRGSALRTWSSTSRNFGMDETAPFAVGAGSGDPESLEEDQVTVHKWSKGQTYPTDLCFIFWVSWDLAKLLLSMSELALGSVPTGPLLFPATAEFRFVKTKFPVVRARAVATRGRVLGDSGGRGSQPTVVRRGTTVCARVLAL